VKHLRCENCKIETNNTSSNCPLCGKCLSDCNNINCDVYPKLDDKPLKETNMRFKWLLFSTIICTMFIFGINLFTHNKYKWNTVAILGVWMLWILFGAPIIKGRLTSLMLIIDNVIIWTLLIVIDSTVSLRIRTLGHVGPFIPSATGVIITLIAVYLKINWKEVYLYQMTIAALCSIPIIVELSYDFTFWPSIVSALYGVATILAMMIFGGKRFKYEAKKRLHF
jgi:hypothetical protein